MYQAAVTQIRFDSQHQIVRCLDRMTSAMTGHSRAHNAISGMSGPKVQPT
jgi:hypothetical protein